MGARIVTWGVAAVTTGGLLLRPWRLPEAIWAAGGLVTVFLSNDATAVVLTPAVAAVARTAGVRKPMPLLLACAFIANAASFVLPISNPANLVVYGSQMPPLGRWLAQYALASGLAIAATYWVLRLTQRRDLQQPVPAEVPGRGLSGPGRLTATGILATGAVLLVTSALDRPLGMPTFLAGLATTLAVLLWNREAPWSVFRGISWGVLPLVAGLFVLVESLERIGAVGQLGVLLEGVSSLSPAGGGWLAGAGLGLASNLFNNLPVGLIAGSAVQTAHLPPAVTAATLVGVDLGPNLSVTGSLATILWLTALRREGLELSGWRFLGVGALVMPVALAAAILGAVVAAPG